MKRSEMRELIRKELLKTVGGDAAKSMAEDILFLIEKAGMQPPAIRKNDAPWDEAYDVNEWEKEDDDKAR